jgi:hypothetical protein
LQPFLADKGALHTLAASVAIPALPAILAEIPIAVILQDLFMINANRKRACAYPR